ncbi:ParA family protein [Magnetospirillum aberrantis]|uniref:ParA family protein n=1 Tax=Magnetospirillum aberrantis SpK TaxID=908842 RepID=A0A7C9QUA3_9PROT|nr:ParA family protein [Magnetospirillum aberrantis]NFV80662.1 ParA family protein [Magnetospirillum aberrantis SpK]
MAVAASSSVLAPRARVVVAATGKGGAGKTTSVACLAVYWARRGLKVCLIDADPNQTLARWHARGDVLREIPLTAEYDADALLPAIEDYAARCDVVVVDCAGFTSQSMLFAVGAADMVLIPAMTDEANLFEAARTQKLVRNASALTRRAIESRVLLCRVKRCAVAQHARQELQKLGLVVLDAQLNDRVAFQEASFFGTAPSVLQPKGAASGDIDLVGKELDALLWSQGKGN